MSVDRGRLTYAALVVSVHALLGEAKGSLAVGVGEALPQLSPHALDGERRGRFEHLNAELERLHNMEPPELEEVLGGVSAEVETFRRFLGRMEYGSPDSMLWRNLAMAWLKAVKAQLGVVEIRTQQAIQMLGRSAGDPAEA